MPWEVKKHGKKFQVVNSETGQAKGPEYPTEKSAQAYLKALYANVPEAFQHSSTESEPTGKVDSSTEDKKEPVKEKKSEFNYQGNAVDNMARLRSMIGKIKK
jgi:hypothetical protein